MRIGMILDKTFPPDPRVENEAVELIKAGNKVFLFCLHYTNENDETDANGIQIKRYKSNTLEYKFSALTYTVPVYSWLMKQKISHFIKHNKIEALHIHDMRIAQATFWANKTFKLKTVLDLHDNFPEIMKFYPHLQKFPGKYLISPKNWKHKEEQFIKKATKVITVSNEFVNEIIERTSVEKTKVELVPNTIRKSFYEDYTLDEKIIEKYKNDFVVLYLGDTNLRRGLQTAIRASKVLKNQITNYKLVIVGSNTTDIKLKQEIEENNLNDCVIMEGWQDVSLFQSYIKASAVCISPLHRNIQHDVAYANKLFQYMSFAKPLLVSNATAQKNLIQKVKAGLVHTEKDADDFCAKILELYYDASLRDKLGNNGQQFVMNEFTWDKTSQNLINLYKNL